MCVFSVGGFSESGSLHDTPFGFDVYVFVPFFLSRSVVGTIVSGCLVLSFSSCEILG
jgi:hypothetical protein